MKKFDKIYRINKSHVNSFDRNEVIEVTEKLDGANFRMWKTEDGNLRFGSKNVDFAKGGPYGKFTEAVNYVSERIKPENLEPFYVLFFEAMIPHNIKYSETPKAILIDIWNDRSKKYVPHTSLATFSEVVEVVPLVYSGKFQHFDQMTIPKSKYYDGEAEGFVIKPLETVFDEHGTIHRAKVVGTKFKEVAHDNKKGVTREYAFVDKFVTNARIEKQILKMKDAGHDIEKNKGLFGAIVFSVTRDIINEEFAKFVKIGRVVNIADINYHATRKTKEYLKWI